MPSKALLFRFSALTFNAHSIHLDTDYARNIEGYRNLLVHGPLSLTLMLTFLQHHLGTKQRIKEIDYRNFAPLLVEEDLTLYANRKDGKHTGAWDVGIIGSNGGLAVRGTVYT